MGGIQSIIMGPLGRTLGLIVLLAMFTYMAGAVNTWFLLTEDVGIVAGERIDRLVGFATDETADDAWAGSTLDAAGVALTDGKYMLIEVDGTTGCKVKTTGTLAGDATGYTPSGEKAETKVGVITGCVWSPESDLFKGLLGGLIVIILSAAGLGLPIGTIIALGSYGAGFVQRMGGSPLLGTILLVIGFLLVSSLLSTLIPFVEAALSSLDGARFAMYDTGIGGLAGTIGGFWGVTIVAGLLYIAWQVVQHFRGATSGGGFFNSGGRGDSM